MTLPTSITYCTEHEGVFEDCADKVMYDEPCALVELRVAGPDDLLIRREDGKWQFDPEAMDGWPDLYEMSPKAVDALTALGVPMFPTKNAYIIQGVLDALAAAEGETE